MEMARATGPFVMENKAVMFALAPRCHRGLVLACLLVSTAVACSQPAVDSAHAGSTPRTGETGRSIDPQRAFLAGLEEIGPAPDFPELAAAAPTTTQPADQTSADLTEGRRLLEERQGSEAVAVLTTVVEQSPYWIEARLLLAQALLLNGSGDRAEAHLREALRHDPRQPVAYLLLGKVSLERNDTTEAIRWLRLALMASEASPDLPARMPAHRLLGVALKEEGYLTVAASQLEMFLTAAERRRGQPGPALIIEPGESADQHRVQAAVWIGEIHSDLQDDRRAAKAYLRAVQLDPDDASLRWRLASSLARSGRHERAMEVYREIPVRPPLREHLTRLDELCDKMGRPERYDIELIRMARSADDPAERLELVRALVRRGRLDVALAVIEGAASWGPVEADAMYVQAELHLRRGGVRKSLALIAQALRAHPKTYRQAESVLASAAPVARSGETSPSPVGADLRKALVEEARQLCARNATDAIAHYLLGRVLLQDAGRERAMMAFRTSGRLDEDFGPAFVSLSRLHIEARQWEDASEAAEAAIDAGLRGPEGYLLKGRACEALDEYDDAEAALLEAFRRDRTSVQALFLLAEAAERRGRLSRCEQLYRRILDEVDPRCTAVREQLVRLYLNTDRLDRAVEYHAAFKRLGQAGPAAARCQAYLVFRRDRGEKRLEGYRSDLYRIIEMYPRSPRTYIDLAMAHLASGAYKQGLAEVARALAIDGADVRARELEALLETKLLRFAAAAEAYGELLKDRPRSAAYQQNLVDLALNEADFDAAAGLLRGLLARDDLGSRQALLAARLVEIAPHHEDAVEIARAWLDDMPADPLRRSTLLSVLGDAGRHEEAISAAAGWLAETPKDADLRFGLIARLAAAERHVEAQRRILSWLTEKPDDARLNGTLIRLCWMTKEWSSAIALAQAGSEQSEGQREYEDLLWRSYVLAGRYDDAVAAYQDRLGTLESHRRRAERVGDVVAVRLYREAVREACRDLITTLLTAERFAEAEQEANRLLLPQLELRDAGEAYDETSVLDARRYLSLAYQQTDRQARSARQLEEIYALRPNNPGVNNDLAYTWADAGVRLDEAERMLRFAVGERPRESAYLDSLGWVLYKRGRIEEAVQYLTLAVCHADQADAVILEHLGDAVYRLRRFDEAAANWEKAIARARRDAEVAASRENENLLKRIEGKLRQLADDEEVQTAPLGGASTTAPAQTDPSPDGPEPVSDG